MRPESQTQYPRHIPSADRNRNGFTLVEMLATLIVITLLTGLVSAGVAAAFNAHRQESFASQAELLSSAVDTALGNPCRLAVKAADSNRPIIQFNGSSIVLPETGGLSAVDGHLYLTDGDAIEIRLLNDGLYHDCEIVDATMAASLETDKDENGDYGIRGSYTVRSTLDPSMSTTYSYRFIPLEDVTVTGARPATATGAGGGSTDTKTVDLSDHDVSIELADGPWTYTGSEQKPTVTVKVGNVTLSNETDHKVAYSNNTNSGTARVTVTGINDFSGKVSTTFEIRRATITNSDLTVDADGSSTPPFAVSHEGRLLTAGADYQYEYSSSGDAGTLSIVGINNFDGVASVIFSISDSGSGSGGNLGGDMPEPTKRPLADVEYTYNTAISGWRSFSWIEAPGSTQQRPVWLASSDGTVSGQIALAWVDGRYYRVDNWGNPGTTIIDSSFSVSDITDGKTHNYGWGQRTWQPV